MHCFSVFFFFLNTSVCFGSQRLHMGSLVAVHGLSSCGVWVLECSGFIATVIRLSCSLVCGILVPNQGLDPNPLRYTGDS